MADDAAAVEAAPKFDVSSYSPSGDAGEFVMRIISENVRTGDGRQFAADSVTWREPPVTVMFKDINGDGHKDGQAGAVITKIWKDGDGNVYGSGFFGSHAAGQELRQLVSEGVISGVSADIGGADMELAFDETTGKETRMFKAGKIMGVTAIPLAAFDDTRIAITASADMPQTIAPPAAWFQNPQLKKATALTVTADGHVFGHAALWGTCHIGMTQHCVSPPTSPSGYAYFNVGQVHTAESPVSAGIITMDTGHAGVTLSAEESKRHYDHTGAIIAHVQTGEDSHGIWFSGAISPRATQEQVATFRAASVSGDWRTIGGSLEMVGLLAVNTPGFPIPRPVSNLVASAGGEVVTAATAINIVEDCGCDEVVTAAAMPPAVELKKRMLAIKMRKMMKRSY